MKSPLQIKIARQLWVVLGVSACLCACGTDPTVDLLDDAPIKTAEERIPPTLVLTEPARGVFTDQTTITVAGTVTDGSAHVSVVEINGVEAPVNNGAFTYTQPLEDGVNVIGIRATAEDKGRAVDAVSVFSGAVHAPGTKLTDAVQIHLGKEFLDDNDPDLDDISSIVALIISDETFLGSLTSEPFQVGDETITVTRIEVESADVDLTPDTNCIDATMSLVGTEIDITTTGIAATFGDEIYVTADTGTVTLRICGTDDPRVFDVQNADVEFENLILATNDSPDLATDLPSVHATLVTLLESAIGSWLGNSFGGFLTQLLDIFELNYAFGALDIAYEISKLSAHPGGLEIILDGQVSSEFDLPNMWGGAGSLKTDDPPLKDAFSNAAVAMAISDDALNQFLFAYWWSGGVDNFDIDPTSLSDLPAVFQPLGLFDVALGLPPTLVQATYPDEFAFDLTSGEVGLVIRTTDGKEFLGHVHLRTGVNISIDENAGMGMKFDGRAQKITVKAGVSQSPPAHEAGDVAALLRLIIPSALKSVDVNYGGFPVPEFSLSAFSENVEGFQNKSITFVPSGSRSEGEGGGYLVVEGALEER